METKAKQFARIVLAIHLLLLLGIILAVFFASREVYSQTREQALRQTAHAQELLTAQTADGIQSFYDSIRKNLDLLHRANDEDRTLNPSTSQPSNLHPVAPTIGLAPVPLPVPYRLLTDVGALPGRSDNRTGNLVGLLLWRQLEGRASLLFAVEPDRLDVKDPIQLAKNPPIRAIGPVGSHAEARKVVTKMHAFLKGVDGPSVSGFQEIPELGDGNLVCVPAPAVQGEKERRLLVAFIPLNTIQDQFLKKLNPADSTTAATLADEKLVTMVSSDPQLIGVNAQKAEDPHVRQLAAEAAVSNKPVTIYIEKPYHFGNVVRQPRMMSMVPVDVLGKRWFLMVSSRLETVDEIVNRLFRRALYWAIAVVVAMTAVLVSTSIWLIRGRIRLERVRHEMLTKELTQAREIQKAWLPQEKLSTPRVQVSAVNKPAGHISGDFYNWFELSDQRLVLTIGDVTGHGMSAAFLMATTQLIVRTTMTRIGDPGLCLEEVNRQLCTQIFVGQFVTMLIAVVDLQKNELQIATAGHYPPLLGNGATFTPLKMEPELVLGVDPHCKYHTEVFDLPPESSLLMYTDGVLDLEGSAGQRFGKDALRASLTGQFESAQATIDHLVQDLDKFRGKKELPDDLTMVVLQLRAQPVRSAQIPPPRPQYTGS